MTLEGFTAELTKAINADPSANQEIRQYWEDHKLTLGVLAAVPHVHGVAALCTSLRNDGTIEYLPLTWVELHEDLPVWQALAPAAV